MEISKIFLDFFILMLNKIKDLSIVDMLTICFLIFFYVITVCLFLIAIVDPTAYSTISTTIKVMAYIMSIGSLIIIAINKI